MTQTMHKQGLQLCAWHLGAQQFQLLLRDLQQGVTIVLGLTWNRSHDSCQDQSSYMDKLLSQSVPQFHPLLGAPLHHFPNVKIPPVLLLPAKVRRILPQRGGLELTQVAWPQGQCALDPDPSNRPSELTRGKHREESSCSSVHVGTHTPIPHTCIKRRRQKKIHSRCGWSHCSGAAERQTNKLTH